MSNEIPLEEFSDRNKAVLRKYGLKPMTQNRKPLPQFYICNKKKTRFIIVYMEDGYLFIDRDYDDTMYGERCYETGVDFIEDLKRFIKNDLKKEK